MCILVHNEIFFLPIFPLTLCGIKNMHINIRRGGVRRITGVVTAATWIHIFYPEHACCSVGCYSHAWIVIDHTMIMIPGINDEINNNY